MRAMQEQWIWKYVGLKPRPSDPDFKNGELSDNLKQELDELLGVVATDQAAVAEPAPVHPYTHLSVQECDARREDRR